MSRKRNHKIQELFYAELKLAGNVPLFTRPYITRKIVSGLRWSCEKRGLRIYDYSIMPERIAMIANTAWGSLKDVLESFKGFSSKSVMLILRNGQSNLETSWMLSVFKEHGPAGKPEGIHIWEEELLMHSLYKQDQIDKCSEFIQNMPVKAGLVSRPKHYLYCSANPGNPLAGWIVEATDPWS